MYVISHWRVALWPLSNFSCFWCTTTIARGCPGLSRAVYTTFQGRIWQSGTCNRTIYALDANYIASACSPITSLDLQQLFMCHNDHMWLSRTVPCCIYTIPRSDMTYGDSLGQCICRLWYDITSQSSRGNILLPAITVLPVSNAYMVPLHVPCCRSKWKCRDFAASRFLCWQI